MDFEMDKIEAYWQGYIFKEKDMEEYAEPAIEESLFQCPDTI